MAAFVSVLALAGFPPDAKSILIGTAIMVAIAGERTWFPPAGQP
jgi:hypothetical protein